MMMMYQMLKDDGVPNVVLSTYENKPTTSLDEIIADMGQFWAVRVVYNEVFGGVFIYPKSRR